jgi:hypothetical protein
VGEFEDIWIYECTSCVYFKAGDEDASYGFCRLYPPRPVFDPDDEDGWKCVPTYLTQDLIGMGCGQWCARLG